MDISILARIFSLRFKSLRLLQLIVEHGSVRQAANVLHVTQPAASAMLFEVERVLGLTLFIRTRSGMIPTPHVLALMQRITVLENELKALGASAQALGDRSRQIHRLGVIPRSMQDYMPDVLANLVVQHPDLEFALTEATSNVLFRGLMNNEFDSIIARPTREMAHDTVPGGIVFEPLYEEGMCIVAGCAHPLANRTNLALHDTVSSRWVLPPVGSVTRDLLVDEFLHAGMEPPVPVIESAGFPSNLSLVEGGHLLTVSPASAVLKYGPAHGIKILDLKLSIPLPRIALIWRAHTSLIGALALLRDAVLQRADAHIDERGSLF